MRRTALLLALPVLAAGLLAGCDLPGGTPPSLSYDRMPNDTTAEAPLVRVPRTITGTVDADDEADWYRLSPPTSSGLRSLVITCVGDVYLNYNLSTPVETLAVPELCDGLPHAIYNVSSESTLFVGAGYRNVDASISPYSIRVEYGPPIVNEN